MLAAPHQMPGITAIGAFALEVHKITMATPKTELPINAID